ncbi:serine hydrolase [Puniceicoccaceae bacterium K14]|nr:serine hydrolase [Puniceicoccaceae bacterium K14]
MKKYLALVCFGTLLISGCGNVNVAHYESVVEGEFWTKWTCLQAVPTGDSKAELKEAFDQETYTVDELWDSVEKGGVSINNQKYRWETYESDQNAFYFMYLLENREFAYTYALAEVHASERKELYLGVGSDDAVKLWVNGELVHKNWTFRGTKEDQDLVPIVLETGANRVVVKILNGESGWGMSIRPLNSEQVVIAFADAASEMDLDVLDSMLESGFDINSRNQNGLTALHMARLLGLTVRTQQLIERGADPDLEIPKPEESIPSLLESVVESESAGLSYLVAKQGKVISTGAFGMADVEKGILLDENYKFRIGSVTKQFASVAILLLQEKGMLSIDDPLSKYIEDFPKGDEVTLRHLLNHTSGIHSYTNERDFISGVTRPVAQERLINKIKNFEYDFEPGVDWAYNNSGYFLIGYVIEKASGMPLGEFWKAALFEPLGMDDTGVYINGQVYENEALGYSLEDGNTTRALNWDMSHAGAAGNLYSTVYDLYLWNEALFGGKLLSESSFSDMIEPCVLSDGTKAERFGTYYGLGVMISDVHGYKSISHGGGLQGFLSALTRFVDEEITVVTLSNSHPTTIKYSGSYSNQIGLLAIDLPPLGTVEIIDKELDTDWSEYVGRYDYGQAVNTVSLEDDQLYTRLTGQRSFKLYNASEDKFYLKEVVAECEFQRDGSGNVTGLRHTQNGRSFIAQKMEPIEVVEIDKGVYELFLGDYELNDQLTVSITKDEDKLWAQATGQGRFEIVPVSKFEYQAKEVNAKIVFSENGEGEVDSFTLYQAGAVMKAPRIK